MKNRTHGGRALNFKASLFRYPKEAYFKPKKRFWMPNSFQLDISKIGVFNQLQQGSCTANAWANLYDYRQITSPVGSDLWFHHKFAPAARDYIYYQERVIDGDVTQDDGSYLHTGAKVLSTVGTVSEWVYPYGQNDLFATPSVQINQWASKHKLLNPKPVQLSDQSIMQTLLSGNPIVFGMPVYDDFEELSSTNDILYPPSVFESPLGGHANMLYGYEIVNGQVLYNDLNSWGYSWGLDGKCKITDQFALQFFSDLWTA